ncbi:hypothetical protein MJG53_012978 [Ovis ammon polii x Ovis aries]|uniref:Uncharacterized protein n=1 Tax=Ovis ammon polii x Ovis aries TaxID=2918886 RepID=A0ACB9UMZ5_9CETA|nr:hypothetical protein MJG53_012978 [Ovis ammon polii x Ovis aries]
MLDVCFNEAFLQTGKLGLRTVKYRNHEPALQPVGASVVCRTVPPKPGAVSGTLDVGRNPVLWTGGIRITWGHLVDPSFLSPSPRTVEKNLRGGHQGLGRIRSSPGGSEVLGLCETDAKSGSGVGCLGQWMSSETTDRNACKPCGSCTGYHSSEGKDGISAIRSSHLDGTDQFPCETPLLENEEMTRGIEKNGKVAFAEIPLRRGNFSHERVNDLPKVVPQMCSHLGNVDLIMLANEILEKSLNEGKECTSVFGFQTDQRCSDAKTTSALSF